MDTRSQSNATGTKLTVKKRGRPAESTQKRASPACRAHRVKPLRLHCTGEAIGFPCTHSLWARRPDRCPDQAEADAAPHPSTPQHKDRFHRRCQLRRRSSDFKFGDSHHRLVERDRRALLSTPCRGETMTVRMSGDSASSGVVALCFVPQEADLHQ